MPAYGSVSITGSVTGFPTGAKSFNFSLSSANAVGDIYDITLAQGDNTIQIPPNATMVFIDPPAGNNVALRLKGPGQASDVGWPLHPNQVSFLPLATGVTSMIINAAAAVTVGPVQLSFL